MAVNDLRNPTHSGGNERATQGDRFQDNKRKSLIASAFGRISPARYSYDYFFIEIGGTVEILLNRLTVSSRACSNRIVASSQVNLSAVL